MSPFPEVPVLVVLAWNRSPLSMATGSPSACLARGMRIYNRQTGGEILPVRSYHVGREDQYRLFPSLVIFSLLSPPLQPGVVGPYPTRSAWFPDHLLLKGTARIHISQVVIGGPRYQGYKTPTPSEEFLKWKRFMRPLLQDALFKLRFVTLHVNLIWSVIRVITSAWTEWSILIFLYEQVDLPTIMLSMYKTKGIPSSRSKYPLLPHLL
jgi:hypothetical protein